MYAFNPLLAKHALAIATPFVDSILGSSVAKRQHMHIIIGRHDTTTTPWSWTQLAERSWGSPDEWEHNYAAIALAKGNLTARTGMSSRHVQLMQPELLELEDIMFWGSTILGNIIVAPSGIQSWFDEVIANAVAWTCRGLIQNGLEEVLAIPERTSNTYID